MTLDYSEHPDATAELLDTVRYYETQRPGLGEEFHVASLSAIERRRPGYWSARVAD